MKYPDGLTEQEMKIMSLLVLGFDTKIIASMLNIALATYNAHMRSIHIKTDRHSMQALINYAHHIGFNNQGVFESRKRA